MSVVTERDEIDDGRRPRRADPGGGPRRSGGVLAVLRETVIVLGTALLLSLLIKTFLVQAFYIPSQSMEPTLVAGDRVLVSQLTPGPFDLERGDVVVFKDPGGWLPPAPDPQRSAVRQAVVDALTFVGVLPQDSGEHLIKRVVGLGGDTVACCDAQGRITVNGQALDESYVYPGDGSAQVAFQVTVPAGRMWVMGDHRGASLDSRFHQELPGEGTVSTDLVVGRAVVTIWPVSRWSLLSHYGEVFAGLPPP